MLRAGRIPMFALALALLASGAPTRASALGPDDLIGLWRGEGVTGRKGREHKFTVRMDLWPGKSGPVGYYISLNIPMEIQMVDLEADRLSVKFIGFEPDPEPVTVSGKVETLPTKERVFHANIPTEPGQPPLQIDLRWSPPPSGPEPTDADMTGIYEGNMDAPVYKNLMGLNKAKVAIALRREGDRLTGRVRLQRRGGEPIQWNVTELRRSGRRVMIGWGSVKGGDAGRFLGTFDKDHLDGDFSSNKGVGEGVLIKSDDPDPTKPPEPKAKAKSPAPAPEGKPKVGRKSH